MKVLDVGSILVDCKTKECSTVIDVVFIKDHDWVDIAVLSDSGHVTLYHSIDALRSEWDITEESSNELRYHLDQICNLLKLKGNSLNEQS